MASEVDVPGLFLNFRSVDAGSYAAVALDGVLTHVFGDGQVFRSSRSIPAGAPFDTHLRAAAGSCDVMLALIGPDWLTAEPGGRLLDRPDDWVRQEIAIGLQRGIPVIPVLLTGARRPAEKDRLPLDVADIVKRQAVHLRHRHFATDVAHLLREIDKVAPALAVAGRFAPAPDLPENALPSMLLRPEYGVVPFAGRDSEVADLVDWCGGDRPADVRIVTGPAGQGKTRLALRLAEVMREDGWLVGVVADDDPLDDLGRLAGVPLPLLLVVDYAEGRAPAVAALVAELSQRQRRDPVRILLLARSAGEWLRNLHEHRDDRVAALFLGAVETALSPLARKPADRHSEFRRARTEIGNRMSWPHEDADPPADLHTARFERALDVHAAALAALLDLVSPDESSDSLAGPITRVLHHERRYWRRTAGAFGLAHPDRPRLDAAVVAATLFGAATSDQAVDLLRLVPAFAGEGRAVLNRYVAWLGELYPGPLALNPLRPDRLGEDLTAEVLEHDDRVAVIPAPTVDDPRLRQAVTVLGRAVARHERVRAALTAIGAAQPSRFVGIAMSVAVGLEDPGPLAAVVTATVAAADDPDLVNAVRADMPDTTVALADLAVLADRHALAAHLRLPRRDPAVTAALLTDLAKRLRQRGSHDEALSVIGEAAEIYRVLARQDQESHLPGFVTATQIRAVCLHDVGRHQEAAQAAEVAVAGFEHLAAAHHDVYGPELANALNVLSNRYRAMARHAEAVAAGERAVTLYHDLVSADRGELYLPDLARTLNGLAVHYRTVGKVDDALAVMADAVGLRQRLAEARPDAYLAELASSLNNHANLLDDIGRVDEAVDTSAECVLAYEQLADRRPEVFIPDLAMALNNHAIACAQAGRHPEALDAAQRGVSLYRRLAEERPERFADDLAMALNTLASRLGRADRLAEAADSCAESVRIRRTLLTSGHSDIRYGLVASLSNYGLRLRALGRVEEALDAALEAVEQSSVLSADPAYRPRFAIALNSLSLTYAELERWHDSASAAAEAVVVYREMSGPQARHGLAAALVNQAAALAHTDSADAKAVLEEAREICDPESSAELISTIDALYAEL